MQARGFKTERKYSIRSYHRIEIQLQHTHTLLKACFRPRCAAKRMDVFFNREPRMHALQ